MIPTTTTTKKTSESALYSVSYVLVKILDSRISASLTIKDITISGLGWIFLTFRDVQPHM
jgi:hypothetical protein